MRKLATVETVKDVRAHNNADSLEICEIRGWQVVTRIGEFQPGETVVYFEIDSFIPTEIAPFLSKGKDPKVYMGVQGERLRTVKLRGEVSQGLILPISVLLSQVPPDTVFRPGDDVSDILGVQKWEPPVHASLQGAARGNFPNFIPKTDEERIENIDFQDIDIDSEYEATLKLDGSSITVFWNDGDVGVCSRNLSLKLDQDGNTFVDTAKRLGLIDAVASYCFENGVSYAVQGELMGPGIQKNREKLDNHTIMVFNIFDIRNRKYLTPFERMDVMESLTRRGYTGGHVPVIAIDNLRNLGIVNVKTSKEFVDRPSIVNNIAEGAVFKRIDGCFSFKSINNKYLLKED